jgi:hypothetical protein
LKHTGPLLGYNNNVPYKGQVYHVQTEDSGSRRPHVITHLFADGGRIVKTKKTSYAHFVESENLTERVRSLMRDQHKGVIVQLRVGELDPLINGNDPAVVARDMVETAELSPDAPLEIIDKSAIQDERDFRREMEELAAAQAADKVAAERKLAQALAAEQAAQKQLAEEAQGSPAPADSGEPPGSGQPASGQAAPGQAAPGQAAPGQAASGQAAPGQAPPGSTGPVGQQGHVETTYSFVGRASAPPRRPERSSPPPSKPPRPSSRPAAQAGQAERAPIRAQDHTTQSTVLRFGERWISNKRFDDLVVGFLTANTRG